MATTSIPSSRKSGSPLEKFTDAVFVRDDTKLYFGDGGDFSIEYDEDGNDVVATCGADLRISDTQQLQFGDGGDITLTWDGSNLVLGSALESLSDVDPAVSNAVFLSSDAYSGAYVLGVSAG